PADFRRWPANAGSPLQRTHGADCYWSWAKDLANKQKGHPMADDQSAVADSSAVRVALWRAMHVQVDAPPHVLDDEIGLQLAAPDDDWRLRPDMDPVGTSWFRAGIVARARFVEDLVAEKSSQGVDQYVILGAGLDTFGQRRPEI